MNNTGLKEANTVFSHTTPGDRVQVTISHNHPIARIRFGAIKEVIGEFVSFKHGVLKLMDGQKKYVMVPAMIISEVDITKQILAE